MAQIGLEVGLFMNLLVSRKKLLGNTGDFLWSYGGYLIVSALCDLCGVVLNESNARNFTTDCIETLHGTLKANLSVDGANYILSLNNDSLIIEFIDFYLTTDRNDIGDSYVKTLEEYKAKYEKNEPAKIVLDSSIVNIKTKWKKESTEIYIPDGDIENLPNGVSLSYALYLFKEGNQCTSITGGWKDYYLTGAQITNVCILLSQSETNNMFAGTINEIDFSKYNKIYLELESNTDFYLSPATSMSASWFSYLSWKEGTDRKIVSFNLNEEKKISTKIYCAIFKTGTAKIYNIWLE